jgi:hypothetical protein
VRCGGRRLHVGGRLMQAAMLYAIEQQCEEVHLVVQNGDAQRRAVALYDEWWICKDSGKRGRVRGADGEQVSFASARPGMEYRIGPVGLGAAMVAVAGMTTRRYYTLDSAPGAVRGQVRAMFEAAHVSAQDGHTWEAHPRDAMHILLEEETRDNNNNNNNNNNNAGTQARATAGSVAGHVARAGWWERMCAALAVDVWERSRLRAGEASLPPRGDG